MQIVRTVPERIYGVEPGGEFGILESYLRALRARSDSSTSRTSSSGRPRSRPCSRQARRAADARTSAAPAAAGETEHRRRRHAGILGELIEADADAGRVLACTIYARAGARADPIYVHAKVAIVDDAWLTIGSANLNEHSLFNDTEMNLVSHDPDLARETRLRLWAEHLELPVDQIPATRPR